MTYKDRVSYGSNFGEITKTIVKENILHLDIGKFRREETIENLYL